MLWRGRRIFRDGYFEALLQQFAQVGFDSHVGQRSTQDDLANPAFAEL
jgi:hypothetical protein